MEELREGHGIKSAATWEMRSSIKGRLAKIFRNAVICFALQHIMAGGSIKTPARLYLSGMWDVLRANITFNGIYSTIDRCVNSLKN